MTVDEIKERVAELMKWKRKDVDSFSLPALREFVRGKDPELDAAMLEMVESGGHLLTDIGAVS